MKTIDAEDEHAIPFASAFIFRCIFGRLQNKSFECSHDRRTS